MTDARRNAYALYLTGTMRDGKIAKAVNVSPATLSKWASDDNWSQDRKNLAIEEMDIVQAQMREIISKHRIDEALKELRVTSKIKDEIEFALDKGKEKGVPVHSATLRDYAIALKTASEVTSKLTGYSEQAVAVVAGEEGKNAQGISMNFTVTGAILPEAARSRQNIKDISADVEVIQAGSRNATDVTVASGCPF